MLHFWDCLANIIKNHRFASLIPGSEHLSKDVIINEQGNCLDVRDDFFRKILSFTCFPINL